MVESRRGLGRGLSALLEEANEATDEAVTSAARTVPIELIRRNPDQPRRYFNQAEIEGLAASIREKGLLQPILVRPAPGAAGEYQIVAGERRWRAAQLAGLREAPVVVRELDDGQALEIAILENVQRSDLNILEEALGYRTLIDKFGKTQESVAQTIGKSRSHVANTVRLLTLPEMVQAHLAAGDLSAGHARALLGATDPAGLAQKIISQGLTVRQAEVLGKGGPVSIAPSTKSKKTKDIDTLDLEKRVSDALGLTVDIRDEGGAGEVRIAYRSLEQLDHIVKKLTRSGG